MNKRKRIIFFILVVLFDPSTCLRIPRDSDSQSLTTETSKTNGTDSKTLKSEASQPVKILSKSNADSMIAGDDAVHLKSHESASPTSADSVDATSKLFQVLNSTLLSVNSLILDAMRNASGQKNEEFERLGGLVRNVQNLISDRGTNLSMDATHQLGTSLQNLQTLFTENEKHLQEHLMNRKSTNQNLTNDASQSRRGGTALPTGPLDNIMRISSQVSRGLTASVREVEDKLTSSVSQIQTQVQSQIQSFVKGINDFFTSAGNVFTIPNLLNLTLSS